MIITIDTKKDTKEDIEKAIELLKKLTETQAGSDEPSKGAFNMFDAAEEDSEEKDEKPIDIVPY